MTLNLFQVQVDIDKKPQYSGKIRSGVKSALGALSGPLLTIFMVFIIVFFLILFAGADPFVALGALFEGAFGSKRMFGETLLKMCPLLLAGLGMVVTFRSGLNSIGAEGQIIIGGLFGTVAALWFNPGSSPWIAIPVTLLVAGLSGALFAAIPGFLKAKLGTSELVNTVMLNYVAQYLLSFMLDKVMREPPGFYPRSSMIPASTQLPVIMDGSRAHLGLIIAAVGVFLIYWLIWRTPLGYQLRVVGYNPNAARYKGIPISRNIIFAMSLHGFFSGLAGGIEIAGVQHQLMNGFSTSVGFDAIAVALLGRTHPLGVALSSLFLAALRTGANNMQRNVQVPTALVSVIQGLIIVFVLMDRFFKHYTVTIARKGVSRVLGARRKKEKEEVEA